MPARPELLDARKRIQERINSPDGLTAKAIDCKFCGRKQSHMVDIPDHVASSKVLEMLLNQGSGRPQEQQPDSGLTVSYTVKIVKPDEELVAEG
jgi:hypothetical protein